MIKGKHSNLILFLPIFLLALPAAALAGTSKCSQILSLLDASRGAQPLEVTLSNPGKLLVHNHEFAEPISKGFSPELLRMAFSRLKAEGAFEIPLNEKGVMVAASRSDYAGMVWFRDMWRGFAGKLAAGDRESARRLLVAGSFRESDPQQTDRRNISFRDPEAYKAKPDRDVLPHVVLDPRTLSDSRDWSFQKDAFGFFLHSASDAEEQNLYDRSFSAQQMQAIISDMTLLIRLKYWEMKSTDAWEEARAIYTSSVAVITGALERFENLLESAEAGGKSGPLVQAYQEFIKNPPVPADIQGIISVTASRASLRAAIDKGYETIFRQLRSMGEDVEITDPYSNKRGRSGDTSLLWLFFHPLKRFTEEDYRLVLSKVEPLLRPAGMLRYTDPYPDAYLNPAYFFGDTEIVPTAMTRVNQEVRGGYIRQAFHTRYTRYIDDVFGEDFAAQWSLGVIVSVQAYASMYEWFPNSPHRAVYKKKAEDYFLRMLAMVTPGPSKDGKTNTQPPGVALDALRVDGYKFPEAITRLRIYGPDRKVIDELSAFSPFSPLYWATAEAIIAFKKLWGIEFPGEEFPGLR